MSAAHDDMDEVLELFLQESAENIELLTMSLVALERRPDDGARMQDAFRAAHSLKGMAATMGHGALARVLHALEDLLGDVRDGTVSANAEVISELLEVVDLCASMLASIEATGDSDADVEGVVARIDRLRASLGTVRPSDAPRVEPDLDIVDAVLASGLELFVLDVQPDDSSLMPAVRCYAALMQAQRVGDVVASDPAISTLEAGELPRGSMRIWLATERSADDVIAEVRSCTEIGDVTAEQWSAPVETPASATTANRSTGDDAAAIASPVPEDSSGAATASLNLGRGRTVRVESARLDALMHGMGELLVQRARLESVARQRHDAELREVIEDLTRAATDIQSMVMDVRMVAIDVVLRRLPRLVRDLEQRLDRRVDLVLSGTETELDRTVIELLGDPLVHLVRNAVDHGLESPEERRAAGKPEVGTLAISATAAGGVVLLRVRDDGRGMQPDIVRTRALERGIASEGELAAMSDEQVIQLCFAPGFSTRPEVSELSGRGVGLDVVRSSVRALGGDVSASSGEDGTVMTIRLPLTLAIVPVLLVQLGPDRYALPTARVRTTLEADDEVLRTVAGRQMVLWGEELVPLMRLASLLGVEDGIDGEHPGQVVLADGTEGMVAILVDRVLTQEDVVTRPVPSVVTASGLLSASAMLGDGDIAFLIDTDAVSDIARKDGVHAAGVS